MHDVQKIEILLSKLPSLERDLAMSILGGLELPTGKNPTEKEVKALLSQNLRIAVYFTSIEEDKEDVVYHFVRDKKKETLFEMKVNCVMCKSRIGDPLKLCGLTKTFEEFMIIFKLPKLTGNNTLYFERKRVAIFPFDWHACFEKDARLDSTRLDPRWQEIKQKISDLDKISGDLITFENTQKKEIEEKKRMEKEIEEKKRLEKIREDQAKREIARKRMEKLANDFINGSE